VSLIAFTSLRGYYGYQLFVWMYGFFIREEIPTFLIYGDFNAVKSQSENFSKSVNVQYHF
jgi:hypothetical protein